MSPMMRRAALVLLAASASALQPPLRTLPRGAPVYLLRRPRHCAPSALAGPLGTALAGRLAVPMLAALSIVPCSLCFVRQAYVFSLSYGLSMVAIGGAYLAAAPAGSAIVRLHASLILAYGARLYAFLLWRQAFQKGSGWENKIANLDKSPRAERLPLVLNTALFYALLASPLAFHAQAAPLTSAAARYVGWAGGALASVGLAIEGVADQQKSLFKIRLRNSGAADRPCTSGLFGFSRHANYLGEGSFAAQSQPTWQSRRCPARARRRPIRQMLYPHTAGEILFWLGSVVMGLPAIASSSTWTALAARSVCALLGTSGIVFIMKSATARLEKRQEENAASVWPVIGADGEFDSYAKYVERTRPLLF